MPSLEPEQQKLRPHKASEELEGAAWFLIEGKGGTPQVVQSHVPDAVKNSRTVTVQNILFTFIQNTVMYKNVHNIFHSVYILKKDNCNFKYFLLTCHINIVLGPFSLLKLYPLLEIFMTGEMLLDGELDLLNQFLKPHT